jgi:hypothetical protein
MGASDSKLIFKQGIFRLSDPKVIPIEDAYWKAVNLYFLLSDLISNTASVLGAARICGGHIHPVLTCRCPPYSR